MVTKEANRPERIWSIDDEIHLFDLICDFKPAGVHKEDNLAKICAKLNTMKSPEEAEFSPEDVIQRLLKLYNLDKVDQVEEEKEDFEEEDEISSTNKNTKETKEKVAHEESGSDLTPKDDKLNEKRETKLQANDDEESSLSSIEIADLDTNNEGLEPLNNTSANKKASNNSENAQTNNENDLESVKSSEEVRESDPEEKPKRITRGSTKQLSEKTSIPALKKRTRSSVKLESSEPSPSSKKQAKKNSSPSTSNASQNSQSKKKKEDAETLFDKSLSKRVRSSALSSSPKQAPAVRRSSRRK